MTAKDIYLADVFKRPTLVEYKRHRNIRHYIIRAKVQKHQPYPTRYVKGMTICGADCTACPYVKEAKRIKINGVEWKVNKKFNCKSFNVVYALICQKENCKEVYIGETKIILKFRIDDHRGYVVNKHLQHAKGLHFKQPGHCLADMHFIAIEKEKRNNALYRKEREEYFIRKFNTYKQTCKKTTILHKHGLSQKYFTPKSVSITINLISDKTA